MIRAVAALFLAILPAVAQQAFTWHSFDMPLHWTERFSVTLHQRTRTRDGFGWLDQIRVGAVGRWRTPSPRFTLVGGYYFQPQHPSEDVWEEGQRLFGGVETAAGLGRKVVWSGRLLAERHINTGRPNYNRYRTSARFLFGSGTVAPWVQNEVLAVNDGFHSMRNSIGIRTRVSAKVSVETGVLYDLRRTAWGGDRIALVTGVRYDPAAR